MTMQLVRIKLTYTESCLESSKAKAFSNWSTTITAEAATAICTMMRMLLGILLRIMLKNRLEKAVTKVRPRLIRNAVFMLPVTASAEQMPSTCKPIGLLANIGPRMISL